MKYGGWLLCGWVVLISASSASAQVTDVDSLLSYDLAEIEIVSEDATRRSTLVSTVQRVMLADIAQADAASADQVMRLIPGAHVQTNSRGETLVYLRGAGERQVALFFDGALLNVPWDNRFDLSLVPAGVIGGMTVAKGVPSVLYGTNVQGGAINLTSRTLGSSGTFTDAEGTLGTAGTARVKLTHLGRTDRVAYTVSGGYTSTNGLPLPGEATLPFSQEDADLRTNTDVTLANLFGQVNYDFSGGTEIGVALLHLDADKGVAPEGHLDPQVSNVRYWRYPVWSNTMLVLNGSVPLDTRGTLVRGAVWGSRFAQTIDEFESVTFETRTERQEDEDDTAGTRLALRRPTGPGELRLALNALSSQHTQQNEEFDASGQSVASQLLSFRQHIWSAGAEYEWRPSVRWVVLFGGSLDGLVTPETGDKPARDPQTDYGITSGVRYAVSGPWTLRAAAGRKVRFPTMRELFGEALGRFLLNPDLKPESSLLTEAGIGLSRERVSGELVAFYNRTFDTIDQQSVQVPGESRSRRQRINLEGSRVFGLEVAGAARPVRGLSVEGHLTWTDAQAFVEEEMRPVAEKPEWLGTLTVQHNAPGGVSAMLQTVFTGRAFSPDDDNVFQELPSSLVLNARVGYRVLWGGRRTFSGEFFARVNNLTDTVVLPQLGLPGPGRAFLFGIDVSF